MKITDVRFYKSIFSLPDLPDPLLPEIAFSGRSNVGKSSLINRLLNRRGIARTSSTPGRTQSINFIEINRSLFFVDLPGYGYAKVPRAVSKGWQHLIEGYLHGRSSLRLLCLIIDARRDPHEDERLFCSWLVAHGVPYTVILTKVDKLNRNLLAKSCAAWQAFLGHAEIHPFSALSGQGKDAVWKCIAGALQKRNARQ